MLGISTKLDLLPKYEKDPIGSSSIQSIFKSCYSSIREAALGTRNVHGRNAMSSQSMPPYFARITCMPWAHAGERLTTACTRTLPLRGIAGDAGR
jgi:hypothetical protein